METTIWKGLLILAGGALLVLTTGTAGVAMINDRGDGIASTCLEGTLDCRDTSLPPAHAGAVAAICAIDVPDCQDTIVEGDGGGFEQCAADGPCGDFDAKCAANTECVEPAFARQLVCPEGASVEDCFEGGVPAGYECTTRESFPVQVVCSPVCLPYGDHGVTILPAPLPYYASTEDPLVDPVDPGIAVGEPAPPTSVCVPGDCALEEVVIEGCLGTDPCARSSEQVIDCLPPDCAISSDGATTCVIPEPCLTVDDPGTVEPYVCEPVEPPSSGGGSSGEGSPGGDGTAPPVEP